MLDFDVGGHEESICAISFLQNCRTARYHLNALQIRGSDYLVCSVTSKQSSMNHSAQTTRCPTQSTIDVLTHRGAAEGRYHRNVAFMPAGHVPAEVVAIGHAWQVLVLFHTRNDTFCTTCH